MIAVAALSAIVVACAVGVGVEGGKVPCEQWLQQCFTPAEYVAPGAYSDSDFWANLMSSLSDAFTTGRTATGRRCRVCKDYRKEESFMAITKVMRKKTTPSPTELHDLVMPFCEAHSDDSRVEKAYDCMTGCPLADALNQVCFQAGAPSCIEPKSNCTNSYIRDDFACGKSYNISADDTPWYFFSDCGYPRCEEACLITFTINDLTDSLLSQLGLTLTAFVLCPDTLTVYDGSDRNDNILVNTTCIEGEEKLNVDVAIESRTFTIALDKSPGGFGKGYFFSSYLINS